MMTYFYVLDTDIVKKTVTILDIRDGVIETIPRIDAVKVIKKGYPIDNITQNSDGKWHINRSNNIPKEYSGLVKQYFRDSDIQFAEDATAARPVPDINEIQRGTHAENNLNKVILNRTDKHSPNDFLGIRGYSPKVPSEHYDDKYPVPGYSLEEYYEPEGFLKYLSKNGLSICSDIFEDNSVLFRSVLGTFDFGTKHYIPVLRKDEIAGKVMRYYSKDIYERFIEAEFDNFGNLVRDFAKANGLKIHRIVSDTYNDYLDVLKKDCNDFSVQNHIDKGTKIAYLTLKPEYIGEIEDYDGEIIGRQWYLRNTDKVYDNDKDYSYSFKFYYTPRENYYYVETYTGACYYGYCATDTFNSFAENTPNYKITDKQRKNIRVLNYDEFMNVVGSMNRIYTRLREHILSKAPLQVEDFAKYLTDGKKLYRKYLEAIVGVTQKPIDTIKSGYYPIMNSNYYSSDTCFSLDFKVSAGDLTSKDAIVFKINYDISASNNQGYNIFFITKIGSDIENSAKGSEDNINVEDIF